MAGKLETEDPGGPFETPDDTTDVIFIVEQKKLYFNKMLLGMCSPVFKRMFTADFKEKSGKEIPLPEKKYGDMVAFLQQIHPLHCGEPITDTNISQILPLADEYDVDSIRKRCEQYIGVQVQLNASSPLSDDRLLFYLLMVEKYKLPQHRQGLLQIGVKRKATDLQQSQYFSLVPSTATRDLLLKRCANLECFADKTVQKLRKYNVQQLNEPDHQGGCVCRRFNDPERFCRTCIVGKVIQDITAVFSQIP
ncbi:hypothetical protein BaRGS_00003724 [Batillaria attramentaria]|uniref:BTB domain-containing protein n=1 Tax=Batillaria attramentaria TaxID=370345 RepID=A0ABD0M058_9CAEN